MSPILLASSSEGVRKAFSNDRLIFLLKSRGAEDRDILGREYGQFRYLLLVLGKSPPRHGHWALMRSGPSCEPSDPTVYKILGEIHNEYE